MHERNLHAIIYTCLFLLLLTRYYDVIPYKTISTIPTNRCKTADVVDELRVLQSIEKKTYTPCPNKIVHNAMESFSNVNLTETEIFFAKFRLKKFLTTIPNYTESNYSGRGIVSSTSSGFHQCGRLRFD